MVLARNKTNKTGQLVALGNKYKVENRQLDPCPSFSLIFISEQTVLRIFIVNTPLSTPEEQNVIGGKWQNVLFAAKTIKNNTVYCICMHMRAIRCLQTIHDCVHNTARYTAWLVYNLNIKETNVHCRIRSVLIKNTALKDSVRHVSWG